MILSYNTTKVNHDNSSIGSVEGEEFDKIEDIMKRNAKIESKNKVLKNPSKKESDGLGIGSVSSSWEENVSLGNTSGISKIDFANQSSENGSKRESINSYSKESLSRGEECIQKEVLSIIEEDSMVFLSL